MSKKPLEINQGAKLEKQSSARTYNKRDEGLLYNDNNEVIRVQIEGEDREVLSDSQIQDVSNKSLDNTNDIIVKDANLTIQDDSDTSKQIKFDVSSVSVAATRTYTFPDSDGVIVVENLVQTLSGKVIDGLNNTLSNIDNAAILPGIDVVKIGVGSVSNAEFETLVGVSSSIQDQINAIDSDAIQVLTNKSIDGAYNTLSNISADSLLSGIDAFKIGTGSVSNVEFSYLDGLTGPIQIQISSVSSNSIQTFTNKTIDGDFNFLSNLAHGAEVDAPTSGTHGITGSFVGHNDVQTLTNKKLVDNSTLIVDEIDDTIELEISVGGAATSTRMTIASVQTENRTITLPDANDTLVGKATSDSLTNKSFGDDVAINGTTQSTTKDTGALVVDGGVGIEKNLNVGGSVVISGDLQVDGTTVTVNTDTMAVEDPNITLNLNGNQATADSAVAGITIEMSDAVDGLFGYDSTLESKFKCGSVGSVAEVVTVSDSQNLTNKIVTGASIVTPSRADVKQDTLANLTTYAASASNGQLCFATDTKAMYQVVDSALTEVGAGGGSNGDADTIHLIRAEDLTLVADLDLSGNNAEFDGGGSITASSLSLSETAADLILNTKVIKYNPNADGSGDYFGFTKAIPLGLRGRSLGFTFEYKNDSTTVANDFRFCVEQIDGTLAGNIEYFDMESFYSNNNSIKFATSAFIQNDCTQLGIGWQNTSTTTTVELMVDNIVVTANPFVFKDLYNSSNWTPFDLELKGSTSDPTLGVHTKTAAWRRVGDSMEVVIQIEQTSNSGAASGSGVYLVTVPDGKSIDQNKIPSNLGTSDPWDKVVGTGFRSIGTGASQSSIGYAFAFSPTQIFIAGITESSALTQWGSASGSIGGNANLDVNIRYTIPIEGWEAESTHMVIPAKAGSQIVRYDGYTSGTTDGIKFTTKQYDLNSSGVSDSGDLFTTDNTGAATIVTATKQCYFEVSASTYSARTNMQFYIEHYNSSSTLLYQSGAYNFVGTAATPRMTQAANVPHRMSVGDYIKIYVNSGLDAANPDKNYLVVKATPLEANFLAAIPVNAEKGSHIYNITQPGSSMTTRVTAEFNLDTATIDDNVSGSNLINVANSGSETKFYSIGNNVFVVTAQLVAATGTQKTTVYKNGVLYRDGQQPVTAGFNGIVSLSIPMSDGDYLSFAIPTNGIINNTSQNWVSILATPRVFKTYIEQTSSYGKQYDLTVTGTNWTTTRAVGIPYKTTDGTWRLKGNLRGTLSAGSTVVALTLSGVIFKNITNYYQAIAGINNGSAAVVVGETNPNLSTITCRASASIQGWSLSFDVELESKPTWAD